MSLETYLYIQATHHVSQSLVGYSEGPVQSTIQPFAILTWQEKGQQWTTDMKKGAGCLHTWQCLNSTWSQ